MFVAMSGARRGALVVTITIATALLAVCVRGASARMSSPPSAAVVVDTAQVHEVLRRAIRQFQDQWRNVWFDVEMARHAPVDSTNIRPVGSGDRDMGRLTPEVRRYLSTLCFIGSPGEKTLNAVANVRMAFSRGRGGTQHARDIVGVHHVISLTWATSHQIIAHPDFGGVCPNWIPYESYLPLDEGEAIDLALDAEVRPPIRLARDSLIQTLQLALTQSPNDEWIAGQLVRFTLDQRDPEKTITAARQCANISNRCAALQGLAFAEAHRFDLAEAAFRRADSLLPQRTADSLGLCIDNETLWITPDGLKSRLKHTPCGEQRAVLNRMWWLADPLWAIPGNERYVAHGTRRVHATIRAVNDWDERYGWERKVGGGAMRELIVRYGWPTYTYWGGRRNDNMMNLYLEATIARPIAPPYTAKEYSADRTALIPTNDDDVIDPSRLEDSHFDLTRPEGKHTDEWWRPEHMLYPTYLDRLHEGQTAMWRRDTNVTYQMAVDDPLRNLDTTSHALSRAVLMGGTAPENTRQLSQTAIGEGHTLRLLATLPSTPMVLSAEVLPRTSVEQALRRRFAVHPPPTLREMKPNDFALSEPLFLRMPNRAMAVPTDEPSVLRYMAGSLEFPKEEPLAIYWESYGFVLGDTVQFELKFRRDDNRNPARFVGGLLGVVSDLRDSVSIKWTEPDNRHSAVALNGSKPVVGRALAVDLTALNPGDYVVSIQMRKSATVTARSERRFTVSKP